MSHFYHSSETIVLLECAETENKLQVYSLSEPDKIVSHSCLLILGLHYNILVYYETYGLTRSDEKATL